MTQTMVWSCWIHSEWLSGGEGGGGRWGRGGGWTNGLSMTQPMVWSCWIHSEWLSGGEGGGGRGGGVDQWPLYDPNYGLELLDPQ